MREYEIAILKWFKDQGGTYYSVDSVRKRCRPASSLGRHNIQEALSGLARDGFLFESDGRIEENGSFALTEMARYQLEAEA